jgi:nucleotide-binding universal stress UspA family protein
MGHILLVMAADHQSQRAAPEAIALARQQGAALTVAVVIDQTVMNRVAHNLDETGLAGEKIGDGVRECLLREYRARADAVVAAAVELGRNAGVTVNGVIEEGDPTEIGTRLACTLPATAVVLVAERRSWLSRLLSGSAVRMPELPGCEVLVIEED